MVDRADIDRNVMRIFSDWALRVSGSTLLASSIHLLVTGLLSLGVLHIDPRFVYL